MDEERDRRVQARYDAIMMGRNPHHGAPLLRLDGHYNTLFKVVREEVEAERERCAKIAEAEPEMPGDCPPEALAAMELAGPVENARCAVRVTKRNIAAEIRRG